MIVRRKGTGFDTGYTPISEETGLHAEMSMDFGIIRLEAGQSYTTTSEKERALLLIHGAVRFIWSNGENSGISSETDDENHKIQAVCRRGNVLDEAPVALHVPTSVSARVECIEGEAELAMQARSNSASFAPSLWKPGEYPSARFGEGTMQDTSTRTVRTIFDAATAPESRMVLGEVVNHPGKWSSYPPHDHAHPEIYHYRIFPSQGYGHAECEDEVFKVRNYDSYLIPPGVVHSQCAAPGYAMYYVWAIPHLDGDRFGPESRNFRKEHMWLMNSDAPIWPDQPLPAVLDHQKKECK